jgi:hypothetical protein
MIEVKDLAQLDRAFDHVAERSEPTETFHFGVNSLVQNVRFALYRDFPIHSASVALSGFDGEAAHPTRESRTVRPNRPAASRRPGRSKKVKRRKKKKEGAYADQ